MATTNAAAKSVTFGYQPKPGTEFGVTAQDRIRVDSAQAVALLRFANPVPDGEELVSATLEVTTEDVYTGSRIWSAQRSDAPDGPYREVNWNNMPAVAAGSTAVTFSQSGSTRKLTFDVTADLALGQRVTDFQVSVNDTTSRWLKGLRVPSGYPRLVTETQSLAVEPVDVTPEGTISVAAPVVQWTEQDGMDSAQVQAGTLDVDGDWATTTWDSGTVSGLDVGMIDTAAEGWTGLADGASAAIRVRQHVAAGWSEYSTPVEITRDIKPTATVTNPGATDADPTPPVTWTSANQTAWRVWVERNGEAIKGGDSGKRSGTATSWTPPVGAKAPGDVLTYHLWTWDNVDRAASPGDPAYSPDTQTTTYTPTASVTGVTTATATQVGNTPAIEVDFTRGSVPDEILVYRDENEDDPLRIDGVDAPLTDWTAAPNVQHTYGVAAVVNNDASETVVEDTVTTEVRGVWLRDAATGRGFTLSAHDLELAYGEVSTVVTPMRAAQRIRRTATLLGAEGSFRGHLVAEDGRTLKQNLKDVWWMRGQPQGEWRLIAGDLNIPVIASDLYAVYDDSTEEQRWIARFAFEQTGELPFEAI